MFWVGGVQEKRKTEKYFILFCVASLGWFYFRGMPCRQAPGHTHTFTLSRTPSSSFRREAISPSRAAIASSWRHHRSREYITPQTECRSVESSLRRNLLKTHGSAAYTRRHISIDYTERDRHFHRFRRYPYNLDRHYLYNLALLLCRADMREAGATRSPYTVRSQAHTKKEIPLLPPDHCGLRLDEPTPPPFPSPYRGRTNVLSQPTLPCAPSIRSRPRHPSPT